MLQGFFMFARVCVCVGRCGGAGPGSVCATLRYSSECKCKNSCIAGIEGVQIL